MSRFHTKVPRKEVRVVNHGGDQPVYEVWLVKPVLLGTAKQMGPQRIVFNNMTYSNMDGPLHTLLAEAGESELAQEYERWKKYTPEQVLLGGMQFATQDKWLSFCKLRGLDNTPANLAKTYLVSKQELKVLGIEI